MHDNFHGNLRFPLESGNSVTRITHLEGRKGKLVPNHIGYGSKKYRWLRFMVKTTQWYCLVVFSGQGPDIPRFFGGEKS